MKRACKTRINDRGFTMIEMVMVLIVMAIVGTFIAFRPAAESNELIAQTEIFKSHLRHAQIRAMNDTVPWGIQIPNANSYVLYRNNAVAPDMLPGKEPGVAPAPQTHTLPATLTITSGVGSTYNFDNWGSPGTATLTITLSDGTSTNSITITRNTGYIP